MAIHSESSSSRQPFLRPPQDSATIMVAEDPYINTFLRTVLLRHGHKVVTSDPVQGSDALRTGGLKVDLVITNQPEAFLPFADTLPMVYIAASPDPELALQFQACRVLRKPFRNDDLLEAVETLARRDVP